MAIKEIVFNGLKWFNLSSLNANQISYNGRRYKAYPYKISFWNQDAIKLTSYSSGSDKDLHKITDECLGVFDNGIIYYLVGNTTRLYLVPQSKALNVIWGG